MPVREESTISDPVKKAHEQKGFDIKYEAELNRHMDRRDTLLANVSRLYTVIKVHFCSKAMVARLEEHPRRKGTFRAMVLNLDVRS